VANYYFSWNFGIADEVRHMFKQISRRFENYQFSKLGSALMTQMPIHVFIELIPLLNISVAFKVAPRVTRMIFASEFDTLCHCRAEISFFFSRSDRLVFVKHHAQAETKSFIDFPRCTVQPVPSTIDWTRCFICQRDGGKDIRCTQQIIPSCH